MVRRYCSTIPSRPAPLSPSISYGRGALSARVCTLPSANFVMSSCSVTARISAAGRGKESSGLIVQGGMFKSCSRTVNAEEPLTQTHSPNAFVP